MSDDPNGRPPGQNNLDATAKPYVDPSNDPSAAVQKPDSARDEKDGIKQEDKPIDPAVQAELAQASQNQVDPSTAEQPEPEQKQDKPDSKTNPARTR